MKKILGRECRRRCSIGPFGSADLAEMRRELRPAPGSTGCWVWSETTKTTGPANLETSEDSEYLLSCSGFLSLAVFRFPEFDLKF